MFLVIKSTLVTIAYMQGRRKAGAAILKILLEKYIFQIAQSG